MWIRSAFQESGPAILKNILTAAIVLLLAIPASVAAQTGDASWLENQPGLQTAIGRTWMAPIVTIEENTLTEFNEEGTPVSETSWREEPSSTPEVTEDAKFQTMSTLVFEFDSDENAADALEAFNEDQLAQLRRDPRAPATETFDLDLGDKSYGHEGTYEALRMDGETDELVVVYALVQDANFVYQIFGIFLPGDHVEITTGIMEDLIAADTGDDDAVFNPNGGSIGGLWEKLNAIEISGTEGYEVYDLEIYPLSDEAVRGDSVVVPAIDIDHLERVPGITGSWHKQYGSLDTGTPQATPAGESAPEGVFNIELWVMEFEDPTSATAAAFSFNNELIEPLGVVNGGGGSFGEEGSPAITMENTGFTQDRSLPEGDAAVVLWVDGTTLYAARVYSNGEAPTPIARNLVEQMATAEIDRNVPADDAAGTGGLWQLFPQDGDELLHGLTPVTIEYLQPPAESDATPKG